MAAFTEREVALDAFLMAVEQRPTTQGMSVVELIEARRHRLHRALAAIDRAVGMPRMLLQEPDDHGLAAMRSRVEELLCV